MGEIHGINNKYGIQRTIYWVGSKWWIFVNVFKAPNIYCFLVVWISTFNIIKKIVSIIYLVSFLSQIRKNARLVTLFRRILLNYFRKCKHTISYVPCMGMKLWKKGSIKYQCQISFWFFTIWPSRVEVDETHIKANIDSDRQSTTREIAQKLNESQTCIQKKIKTAWQCQETRFTDPSSV